ncbi:DUF4307 domain-containing protein [Nocardia gamkensis]|uniref:DUF4307 domain-containing protein n=1 Tax=Nocardia gamkensis TaxID=352869 RepID=A0A7X6R1P2_9NOCA|nr:DUF4307 domain-containing protein [Nocardia gamkensis]NKY25402.1 DUF4307 domain-containing protein [Nocardia gamkensis]NQE69556.1 hypothetical protein [Nocardia gamkensis]
MSQPTPEPGGDAKAAAASPGLPPADRYGTRPRKPRRWIVPVLGVLVVLAGLGVAYLGYQKYGPEDIEAEQLGYVVVDDSTMTIRLKVTRADPERPVVCFVRAMARDGSELGRREVLVEPSSSGTVELTTVVRSSARPASGSVYACSDRVPGYLRAG